MSEESQDAFMGLQNSHLQNGTLFGTARTNGYGLEDDLKDETGRSSTLSLILVADICYHDRKCQIFLYVELRQQK